MDRKEFLSRTVKAGLCCGAFAVLGSPAPAEEGKKMDAPEPDARDRFLEGWIGSLMETMDSGLDEKTRIELMVANGRACARRGAMQYAKDYLGDLETFVGWFNKAVGENSAVRTGDTITLTWENCECPVVKDGPERLSDTYCHCSAGWVHEMFETVAGKPVKVNIVETVKRGNDRCLLTVHV
jgi:predicted hydrocarbon binding protein